MTNVLDEHVDGQIVCAIHKCAATWIFLINATRGASRKTVKFAISALRNITCGSSADTLLIESHLTEIVATLGRVLHSNNDLENVEVALETIFWLCANADSLTRVLAGDGQLIYKLKSLFNEEEVLQSSVVSIFAVALRTAHHEDTRRLIDTKCFDTLSCVLKFLHTSAMSEHLSEIGLRSVIHSLNALSVLLTMSVYSSDESDRLWKSCRIRVGCKELWSDVKQFVQRGVDTEIGIAAVAVQTLARQVLSIAI
jgi:hypothetical protein